jgi:hypothetical protein
MTIAIVLSALLGGAATLTITFLVGRLMQQRAQVLDLRGTNVKLFQENQNLRTAYEQLHQQVQKIQSGPVTAVLTYEGINQIAEIVSAKIDSKTLNGRELYKKDVH